MGACSDESLSESSGGLANTDCSGLLPEFLIQCGSQALKPKNVHFLTSSKGITMLLDCGTTLEGPLTWKMNSTPGLNISREALGRLLISQPQPLL